VTDEILLSPHEVARLLKAMAGPHGIPPAPTDPADVLIVFGCDDPQLAHDAAALVEQGSVRHVVFSGGTGKDSGGLADLGLAEADFLASIAIAAGMPTCRITIERDARNAAQNAANSLRLVVQSGRLTAGNRIASLAPARRSRRLYEELRFQAAQLAVPVQVVAGLPSGPTGADQQSGPGKSIIRELTNELRGLSTMHLAQPPRIFPLEDFQPGGKYFDLVLKITR
jgi:hypothetical protein